MEKFSWIQGLVDDEALLEESGLISTSIDREQILREESVNFLTEIKMEIIDVLTAFNELKNSSVGQLKIYDISGTECDFMIFRNGYRLIFSLREPGKIAVKFQFTDNKSVPLANNSEKQENKEASENIFEASWGAFNAITWNYKGLEVKIEKLVHHYITNFLTKSVR